MDAHECYLCEKLKHTRPYGEDFQQICFTCLKSSPEIEAMCAENFKKTLEQCGNTAIITDQGPAPGNKNDLN